MSHRYASELHPDPNRFERRVCEGCGCTDDDACLDPETGEACYWVEAYDGDLCSVCGRIALAMTPELHSGMTDAKFRSSMVNALERGYTKPDSNEPLIVLATEHEADLEIRERRKAAGRCS